MKKTIYLTILLFSTNIYTSCNQTTLTNEEAKALIKKDLGVPVSFHQDLTKQATIFSADILNVLRTEGLVNGQRKYFKTMFPPTIANNLIATLYRICENNNVTRSNERFKLEE